MALSGSNEYRLRCEVMMKKRKNVQFIAAAALTAALVTSQFSFATVMGD